MYYSVYYEFNEDSEYYRDIGDNEQFDDEGFMWDFINDLKDDGAIYIVAEKVSMWGGRECDRKKLYVLENGEETEFENNNS